jgi:LmbE family N-acetylglucosaminyl deacetylase
LALISVKRPRLEGVSWYARGPSIPALGTGGESMGGGNTSHEAAPRVSFYFSAHPDDWQLFMNPSAFRDVLGGLKTVFVHVTAGDAGLGAGDGGHPYFLAREQGAENAIAFMVDAAGGAPAEKSVAPTVLNGRTLRRVAWRNAVAYFLRLPDGSPEGDGYAATGNRSLRRLADGRIGALAAVDGSAAYGGWRDLVATLRALVDAERGRAAVDVHLPELDAAVNPGDHPDHVMTAKLARDAVQGLPSKRLFHHLGYACGALPENLAGFDRDMKCAVYAVTLAAIQALGHSTDWRHYDESFVARDYSRVEAAA